MKVAFEPKKISPAKLVTSAKSVSSAVSAKSVTSAKAAKPTTVSFSVISAYKPKKGEAYMSPEMQAHFKKMLLTWKASLRQAVDRTVKYMKETATNFSDLSDRATQEETFGLELRERDRERKLIDKIDESLRVLDGGSYGYCEICGEEIGMRRLEIRPTATLCIDCKTLDEIKEKQIGG